jgi:hypothetical protein
MSLYNTTSVPGTWFDGMQVHSVGMRLVIVVVYQQDLDPVSRYGIEILGDTMHRGDS